MISSTHLPTGTTSPSCSLCDGQAMPSFGTSDNESRSDLEPTFTFRLTPTIATAPGPLLHRIRVWHLTVQQNPKWPSQPGARHLYHHQSPSAHQQSTYFHGTTRHKVSGTALLRTTVLIRTRKARQEPSPCLKSTDHGWQPTS
jgi:hypothetical protein